MSDDHNQTLPPGYMLDIYLVEKVLGAGGFGITYLARDTHLDALVAIKEYLPSQISARTANMSVVPRTEHESEEFLKGRDRFLDEARTLAQFGDAPSIVRVLRFFEANGTAYIVMQYVAGQTLAQRIRSAGGALPAEEARGILLRLMDGLERVHRAGFLHRDIKPGNILLDASGAPTLIDFGAARLAIGARSQPLSVILTVGYAPIEQYSEHDEQGPFTDIYGLAAVGYAALTGGAPPEATLRRRNDPYQPLTPQAQTDTEKTLYAAIDWGLRPDEEERPQTIEAWRAAFLSADAAPALEPATAALDPPTRPHAYRPQTSTPAAPPQTDPASNAGRGRLLAGGAFVAAALVLAIGLMFSGVIDLGGGSDTDADPSVEVADATDPAPSPNEDSDAADDDTAANDSSGETIRDEFTATTRWVRYDLPDELETGRTFGIEASGPFRVRMDGEVYLIDGGLAFPAALADLESDFLEFKAVAGSVDVTFIY